MNVFLLMVALTAPVEAPKAGLQEAAAANAAVAFEAVLPVGSLVKPSEAVAREVSGATACEAAWANAPDFDAALPSKAGETTEPVVLDDIKDVIESVAHQPGILPEARSDFDCNLCEVFRRRPLSGPWSVTRRLNAARLRGDEDEVERLTALLENAVGEALEAEGAEP